MIMMNIIEKLGGYDNAKKLRGTTSNALLDMKTWQVHVDDIDEALLEYRREHNIFQEGDAIVRRWNNRVYWIITDVDNGSEFMISENKNARFKDCKVCDMPCNFTHATPEEIAAGRRL